jgi:hypothetical protein
MWGVIQDGDLTSLFRGFAATASAKTFETVSTLSTEWPPRVEEDQIVNIAGGSSS